MPGMYVKPVKELTRIFNGKVKKRQKSREILLKQKISFSAKTILNNNRYAKICESK
jgi:hypothetical protein